MNTSGLMISVAGVRGIVGESLTPPVLARFAAAFARELDEGPVVIGRDARTSGPMVHHAVTAGLMAAGRDVVIKKPVKSTVMPMVSVTENAFI